MKGMEKERAAAQGAHDEQGAGRVLGDPGGQGMPPQAVDDATASAGAEPASAGPAGITRRQLIAAGAMGAVLVGAGSLGLWTRESAQAAYLRPPGAQDEAHLLARCDRCQRCVQACPYDLVQPRPLTVDFTATGTPELLFKRGYCDFCMKCVEACPTGALSAVAPSAHDIGVAKVVSDACVAWDWGGCTVCAERCPVEGAVTLDDRGRPHVDEELCDGCGLCEMVCPAPSLRAYDASTAEKGIYVVSRLSEAAAMPGALTSAELSATRTMRATGSHGSTEKGGRHE